MELLSLADVIIVVTTAVVVGFTSFKFGMISTTLSTLNILAEKGIIEKVPCNNGDEDEFEVYSGYNTRYDEENIIIPALYEFMRAEMIQGNISAWEFYNNILKDRDKHLEFLKKYNLPNEDDVDANL